MLTILLAMLEDEEDQRKFLKLHTAYEQKLYRIALKILRSHELAEDAVQQSWVQVIQHFEKVKQVPWGAVDGYLVVIVKNVSMTMLRKENHTGSTAGGLGRPGALRPGDGRDRAHRGADPLHAGAVPGGFGAAVRVGVQQSGDRQGAEAQHLHRGHAGGRGRKLLIEKLQTEGYCYE